MKVYSLLIGILCGFTLAVVLGLRSKTACYETVAVTPASSEMILFNTCTGEIEIKPIHIAPPQHGTPNTPPKNDQDKDSNDDKESNGSFKLFDLGASAAILP
jgi:hypothetical protein